MAELLDTGFSRIHVETVNNQKAGVAVYDFAFAEYIAFQTFFDEMTRLQNGLIQNGKVKLRTGQEVDLQSVGGAVALQIYMQTVDSNRQVMEGLARLGLNVEKQLWKMQ